MCLLFLYFFRRIGMASSLVFLDDAFATRKKKKKKKKKKDFSCFFCAAGESARQARFIFIFSSCRSYVNGINGISRQRTLVVATTKKKKKSQKEKKRFFFFFSCACELFADPFLLLFIA
jgi:hypothetical protein